MSIDRYFFRVYHETEYNCLHFARDVWRDISGVDITDYLLPLFRPETKKPALSHFKHFRRLSRMEDPCLVLLTKPKLSTAHIGIFLRGRILHIQAAGVQYQPLDVVQLGFKTVRFYRPCAIS